MICGKCNNVVPDNFAFCPYCGQKVETAPVPPVEAPVIARSSAMPKEEEYSGKYESGDMPAPEIRFSRNLKNNQPAAEKEEPAQQPAPVAEEPKQLICRCGTVLREGAKFCTVCGTPVQAPVAEEPAVPPVVEAPAVPPVVEEPVAPPVVEAPAAPPVVEEPVVPPVVEEPAAPPVVEAPAAPPVVEEPVQPKCAGCGAPMREGAKFCTSCGLPVQQTAEPEAPVPVQIPAEPEIPAPVQQTAEPKVSLQQDEKLCPACNAVIRKGAKFCNICGQKMVEESPAQQAPAWQPEQKSAPVQQNVALKKCPLCGTVVPADAPTCSGCGVAFRVHTAAQQGAAPAPAPARVPKAAAPKKKSMAPLAIILVVALLAVGVVVAGFLTNWFGFAAPLDTIYNATNNTLRAGGFHVDFEVTVPEVATAKGSADCVIDMKKHELTAMIELKDQNIRIGVLDGTAVIEAPDGSAFSVDVSEYVDMVFDELEDEMTLDEALEKGIELALEEGGMEDVLDGDKLFDCIDKTINSSAWLKENAGYSTESEDGAKMHVFAPKLGDLVIAAVEALEPAFEDADDLEEALDGMKESKSDINDMADVELAFGVKGGKLVKIAGELSAAGQSAVVEVTFEDIGSAKVDTDEIEDMIDSANTGAEAVAG